MIPPRLPTLVGLAGVIYSLTLQWTIPGPVFPSGDAGVKFLLTKQWAEGTRRLDLAVPLDPAVERLWAEGFSPLRHPNVVERGNRRYPLYPPAFPVLSAPFYAVFGFRGLTIVPLVATWAIWLACWRACRLAQFGRAETAAVLATVAFASPITFYSATFWEHTLGLAFACWGLVATYDAMRTGRTWAAAIGGVLLGASPAFREELYVLVGVCGLAATVWALASSRRRPVAGYLIAGLAVTLSVGILFNWQVYDHPLGLHAATAMGLDLWTATGRAFNVLRFLASSLWLHFPLGALALLAIPLGVRNGALRPAAVAATAAATLTVFIPVAVRLEGGRQWGPRYLLIVVPLAAFALGGLLQDSVTRSPRRRAAAWAVFALFFAIGAWTNVAGSARYLSRNYARRMVAYRAVAATPYRWVVVSHEAAALQLAALFEHKQFIYGPRSKDLRTIARGLAGRGDAGFLYVCDPYYGCGPFGGRPKKLTFFRPGSSEPIAMFSALGECDRYLLYDVRLAGA